MNISEVTFTSWAQPPSASESARCDNAETAIRKAIATDNILTALPISVFAVGSFRARTNVRQNSDVDICVQHAQTFYADYPSGKSDADFGNVDGILAFGDFKNLVANAMREYFGADGVTRGNKAIDVHANTYRIDADVVPAFQHRRYTGEKNADGSFFFHQGTAFICDSGELVKNWPQQNYDNGVVRQAETGRRYKRVIRILKRMRDRMIAEGDPNAKGVASFLIESLVWNAPVVAFGNGTYTADLRHVLADLWNRTRRDEDCADWGEVNELKYLFRSSQGWSREQANRFVQTAWDYAGFE